MHSIDGKSSPITSQSVFLIAKSIKNIVGKDNAKKTPSGDLLVEVMRKTQSENLLKPGKMAHLSVTVCPHRTLNTVQVVISETDADLLEGLKDRGFISVCNEKRWCRTEDPTLLPFLRQLLGPCVHPRSEAMLGHGTQACCGKLACAKCGGNDHCSAEPPSV